MTARRADSASRARSESAGKQSRRPARIVLEDYGFTYRAQSEPTLHGINLVQGKGAAL